jgi:WD40 repeat protein
MRKQILTRGCTPPLLVVCVLLNAAGASGQKIEIVPSISHSREITSVAVSPDGQRALTGSYDETIKLWDIASGQLLKSYGAHSSHVASVAFSPDGQSFVSGDEDGTLKVWAIQEGAPRLTCPAHELGVTSVAFSPDGHSALSGGNDNKLKLWDFAQCQPLKTFVGHSLPIAAIAISPDGKMAVSAANEGTLKLWDIGTERLLRNLVGHAGFVYSVTFSPDGTKILSGGTDTSLRLWETSTGKLVRTMRDIPSEIHSVQFSPDGALGITGSDVALQTWDLASGKPLRTVRPTVGNWMMIKSVARLPDALHVLVGGEDRTLRMFDLNSGRLLRAFGTRLNWNTSVAFLPDGLTAVAGGSSASVTKWSLESGRPVGAFNTSSGGDALVAVSPDGLLVAAGKLNSVTVWDAKTNVVVRTIELDADVSSLAFAPNGQSLLVGGLAGRLNLWEVSSGKRLRDFQRRSFGTVHSVAFSPDGQTVLAGSGDRTLRLWEVGSGRLLRSWQHANEVVAVAFSLDGKTAISAAEALQEWELSTGKLRRKYQGLGDVSSVAFSPDGQTILTGARSGMLVFSEFATGAALHKIEAHTDIISSIVASPNGRTALTTSYDGTVKLWDMASGTLLANMVGFDTGQWLTITPEGYFDASERGAKSVSAVRGFEIRSVDQLFQALFRPDLLRQKLSNDFDDRLRIALAANKLNLEDVLNSGPPPQVSIISPKEADVLQVSNLSVQLRLVNKGGGIGRLEWRVNGVTLGVENLEPRKSLESEVELSRSFSLGEGANFIEVVAYNSKNLIASVPATVAVTLAPVAGKQPSRLFVVAVGVDSYENKSLELKFAAADAQSVSAALELPRLSSGIYDSVHIEKVINDSATLEKLSKLFERLRSAMRPSDTFVLYMAGHGVTEDAQYHFIPQDDSSENHETFLAKSISQDQIQAWMTMIPALRSVLIYDTCESGSAIEDSASAFRGLRMRVAVEKLSRSVGRTVLAATSDTASAKEGYMGHGLFTYVFLQALALADENNNGTIEVGELANYLTRALPATSKLAGLAVQRPQVRVFGADFTLANRMEVEELRP